MRFARHRLIRKDAPIGAVSIGSLGSFTLALAACTVAPTAAPAERTNQVAAAQCVPSIPYTYPLSYAPGYATPRVGGIVTAPDGNVWFTDTVNNQIVRVTPSGITTPTNNTYSKNANPGLIARGPDGALWFTEPGVNKVGRIDPTSFQATDWPSGTQKLPAAPTSVAAGADGNVWVTAGGTIGYLDSAWHFWSSLPLTFPKSLAGANYIVPGPDGTMWFAGNSAIGQESSASWGDRPRRSTRPDAPPARWPSVNRTSLPANTRI